MRDPNNLPVIDGPLEAWCPFCASRNLPPDTAYCAECQPAYRHFGEGLSRRPGQRIARALLGDVPDAVAGLSQRANRTHLR
jgi:hypothetical protein